jgi:RNA polymerase sigma-70 factor (ECF subfamily)
VDGRPAVLVHGPDGSPRAPAYFVLLEWVGGRVARIRDFHYARYATEGAELSAGAERSALLP